MELKSVLEAILFSAQKALSPTELRDFLIRTAESAEDPGAREYRRVGVEALVEALEELAREHEDSGRSYRLVNVAGAWQFVTRPDYAPWLRTLIGERGRPGRLSLAALETLAIVAYRQPLTRAEIEQVRGVSVDGVMQTLLERGLVEAVGRAEVVGRPQTYGTTPQFLEYFGLASLDDLPAADELRRLPVQRPASLTTAEPGLATVPPEQLSLDEIGPPSDASAPATGSPRGAVPEAAADPASTSLPAPEDSERATE